MEAKKIKILLVDDEPDIIEFLGYNLKKEGFDVVTAHDGSGAIAKARAEHPDLILLDVMMPGMDGMEVCQLLRDDPQMKDVFIVLLTARGEDYSQVAGFDSGADDYVKKPVKPNVLISRIKAMLRRKAKDVPEVFQPLAGDLIIDRERYLVIKSGKEINLSKKEFELLVFLSSRTGKVFSRDDIFANVWGSDVVVGERTIDVHIRKLREKIGSELIKTYKGIGYCFG
jgi:two-component system alkaline phosphatase synthesis response regulator PhoP